MLDRQDIDALLIGSLYGELSSTEEARLAAHLESHPADRTALANLSAAREIVRESRILKVQFEPSQSISALLMQEAVRRAPKPADEVGWFQRFLRSFVAHPAWAAAMMLVLIVGVAGTMYLRKGDQFANQTKDDPTAAPAAPAPTVSAEHNTSDDHRGSSVALGAGSSAPADDFKVQLRDELDGKVKEAHGDGDVVGTPPAVNQKLDADANADKAEVADREREQLAFSNKTQTKEKSSKGGVTRPTETPKTETPKTVAKKPAKYLEVTTPQQAPKDFEPSRNDLAKNGEFGVANDSVAQGRTGGEGAAPSVAPGTVANTRPSTGATATKTPATEPSRAERSRTVTPAPPPPAPPPPVAEQKKEDKPADPETVWAQQQHQKAIAQVKLNNCDSAASIALQISNRNPGYFAANVENDRLLKPCFPRITAEREKQERDRAQRAKAAQKRTTTEDAAKAAPATSK